MTRSLVPPFLFALGLLVACDPAPEAVDTTVMTEPEQDAMTPDQVLDALMAGNERFVSDDLTQRDHSEQRRRAVSGQYPKAVVLSCVDSRVPVEDVFDRGIGDIFVARVAGNFVNEDILGSMEFATAAAGAKLVMVMGHEHCGAVKSAIDGVEMGNITAMLDKIEPAVERASDFPGEQTSDNPHFVHEVCEENVQHTIEQIRLRSTIIADLEAQGEVKIVGAIYDMDTGRVELLD